ncbi:hypothetical protein IAS59_005034 [Cryptococcus gattii]
MTHGDVPDDRKKEVWNHFIRDLRIFGDRFYLKTLKYETDMSERDFKDLADYTYSNSDLAIQPPSGSLSHNRML